MLPNFLDLLQGARGLTVTNLSACASNFCPVGWVWVLGQDTTLSKETEVIVIACSFILMSFITLTSVNESVNRNPISH